MTTSWIEAPPPGDRRSFWLEEALAADRGAPCPPLERRIGADVCVLGGGFAGMWAAYELTEREPGLRIVLLEQDICGGGASGRNGGFFSSSWHEFPELCGLFGLEEGRRYATALAEEVDEVGRWLDRHGIDAWFHAEGVMAVRTGSWQEGDPDQGPAAFAVRNGRPDAIRPLTLPQARAIADSPRITSATFTPANAICQPARLARGLRRVLLERGVAIFEGTRAISLEEGTPTIVRAERGAVRADHVVLTIGAWAAAWPGYRTAFGNIADYMVVTEPIPDRIRDDLGWTSWTGLADGRDLLYYLRRTDDGRLAIGGGSTGVVWGGSIGRRATHDRRVAQQAARGLVWLFPQLEGVRCTHAWGGPIDMTPTFVPFFHTRASGNVHAGLGFSGHGLAQTKLGGRILASLVLGSQDRWSTMPVVGAPIGTAPPEPLRWPLVRLAVWGMESGDRADERGRGRGPVARALQVAPLAYREALIARRRRGRDRVSRP
ncbi:MAG: FAD-binding oxidoreductase [Actinomycetota bacterium]